MKNDDQKAKILGMITDLNLKISSKYENIHVYNGSDVKMILEDMLLTEVSAAAINEYIECSQDGELVIDIKDTDILLELEGEKFVNIVTEYVSPVEIMNAMKIHNISARHPAYEKLAAQLEEIKRLAIRLADLEGDGENE